MALRELTDMYLQSRGLQSEEDAPDAMRILERYAYTQGAHDIFEEIVKWLQEHAEEYIWYDEVDSECGLKDSFEEHLRKDVLGDY